MSMFRILAISIAAIAFTGCVSSSKHKTQVGELQTQLSTVEKNSQQKSVELQEKNNQIKDLEDKLVTTTKDRGQLKSNLDEMKQAMQEMRARQAEQRQRLQEFTDLTKRFKALVDSGTLSVKIVDGKMVVSLGSDVLFASGSARLSAAGQQAIKEVATQLAAIPQKRYQVEGHTDNVPIATAQFPTNWELASARSLMVTKSMIEAGLPAARVSAASYADTAPVQSNDTAEGKAANRRIAIVVVPDLSSLPGYEELQKLQ